MGKRTLVRVPQGTVLSDTMLANLKDIFQQEFDIEYYKDEPDLQRNYFRRRDSLLDAFKFIIQTIPTTANLDDINKYLDWCVAQSDLPANLTLSEYQTSLSKYTALLTDALVDYWPFSKEGSEKNHQAIELLNKAEQFVIMKHGRPDLATLSRPAALKGEQFVIQWDKQLPPCLPETLEELGMIRNSSVQITPKWFRALPFYQQVFLQESESHHKDTSLLKMDLNTLQLNWIGIKTNHKATLDVDFASIVARERPLPTWFANLSPRYQSFMESMILSNLGPYQIDSELKKLTNLLIKFDQGRLEDIEQLRKLPEWFTVLPDNEQRLLKASLLSEKNVEDAVSFIPSRLRTVPGLANFAEHHLLVTSKDGEVLHHTDPRLRSSHISSRDVKKQPIKIGELHTSRNLKQLRAHAGIKDLSIQTLISPVKGLSKFIPDGYLYDQLCKGVKDLRAENPDSKIYLTNHPFNVAKRLMPTWTSDEECNALLLGAEQHLKKEFIDKGIPDSEFWAGMIRDGITFSRENNTVKGYTELLQIMQKNPLVCQGISLDRLKELVHSAFTEARIRVQNKLEPIPMKLSAGEDEKLLKYMLTDLFEKHYEQLSSWTGWQSVFANHYHAQGKDNSAGLLETATRLCDLTQISCEYRNLLGSGYGTATILDTNGRELWLSSLENLQIILENGISYGSCVSGKDRKSLEQIHTDAMILYRLIYGSWPSINDTGIERANFVELVVDLYETRQAHEHADQNAPGANGIKTPYNYFPGDIVAEICKRRGAQALVTDDILATNNEVDRIGNTKTLVKPNYARYVMAVLKLNDEKQEKLWNVLKDIFEDGAYWEEKKSWSPKIWNSSPQAISQIKGGLDAGDNRVSSIANIYYEISQRSETSYWRATETQELYGHIRSLSNAPNPESLIDGALKQFGTIRQNVMAVNVY